MSNKTNNHGKKNFLYCLQCLSSSKRLECHIKNFAFNHAKSVSLPKEVTFVELRNFKKINKSTICNLC